MGPISIAVLGCVVGALYAVGKVVEALDRAIDPPPEGPEGTKWTKIDGDWHEEPGDVFGKDRPGPYR